MLWRERSLHCLGRICPREPRGRVSSFPITTAADAPLRQWDEDDEQVARFAEAASRVGLRLDCLWSQRPERRSFMSDLSIMEATLSERADALLPREQ